VYPEWVGMDLDTEVPTPPDLTNRGLPADFEFADGLSDASDLRREDLEEILRDGAWQAAFEEWAQYTDLGASDVEYAADLGLFKAFDFFWDPDAGRLRYVTPAVPADWDGPDRQPRNIVQADLDDLGRAVAETIMAEYVDWGSDESDDLVWGVETFGQVPTGEE